MMFSRILLLTISLVAAQDSIAPTGAPTQTEEVCIDGDLFRLVNTEVRFDAAVADCESQGGYLAKLKSSEQYEELVEFLSSYIQETTVPVNYWIGIRTLVPYPQQGTVQEYIFYDDEEGTERWFQTSFGEYPWLQDRPHAVGENGVYVSSFSGYAFAEAHPNNGIQYICSFEDACEDVVPTPLPTGLVTVHPTVSPTSLVTVHPTVSPTSLVTEAPTSLGYKSICEGGDKFIIMNDEVVTYDVAIERCENIGASLAKVRSAEQLQSIVNALDVGYGDIFFWLGIRSFDVVEASVYNFAFYDGDTEGTEWIHTDIGEYPWTVGSPIYPRDSCVSLFAPEGLFLEFLCDEQAVFAVCSIDNGCN